MALIIKEKKISQSNIETKYLELSKWIKKNKDKISFEVINITSGDVIYKDDLTRMTYEWSSGSTQYVPSEVIINMISHGQSLIGTLALGIVDFQLSKEKEVTTDINKIFKTTGKGNYELTLSDIIKALGLDDIYKHFEYQIDNIDSYIIELKATDFETLCNELPKDIVSRIAIRYSCLFDEGYINDRLKETVLANALKKEYLFKEI